MEERETEGFKPHVIRPRASGKYLYVYAGRARCIATRWHALIEQDRPTAM